MSVKLGREEFLHTLESVQAGVSAKEILEQSDCFILQGGKVITFNDEISCKAKSGLPKEITGAVKAEKLLELLRKLPEEHVEVSKEGQNLIVKAGKRKRATVRMEEEIRLPLDVIEKPGEWQELHDDFGEAINLVQYCASKDANRFALMCVQIHPEYVMACDNLQLCQWRVATGLENPILVKQVGIKHITSAGVTHFSETEKWIHFANQNGLVISCRRYIEEYPDLSEFLTCEGPSIALPKGLTEAADRARIFSKDSTEGDRVLVELKSGEVTITGEGTHGKYQEDRKASYTGPDLGFMISPDLLTDLVKRYSECVVSPDRLKVDGGSYVYVACLTRPSTNGHAEEITEEEVKKVTKRLKKKGDVQE